MANSKNSAFKLLNGIDVNEHTETKEVGGTSLTYLSWAWAWKAVKEKFPDANYEIVKFDGLPYVYDVNTGYMVYTKVTIEGITHEMWLPVMDGQNKAMKAEPYNYTVKNPSFKYAKWNEEKQGYYDKYGNKQEEFIKKNVAAATMFDVNKTVMRCLVKNLAMFGLGLYIYAGEDLPTMYCEVCGDPITDHGQMKASGIAKVSKNKFGKCMCYACAHKEQEKQDKANSVDVTQIAEEAAMDLPYPV